MNKLLLVCLLVLAPVSMALADLKIAVVDVNKAFNQYYKTKDLTERLNEKIKTYQKELQDLEATYQHVGEETEALDKAAHDPTLSKAAQDDKAKALDAKKQDLLSLRNHLQELETQYNHEIQEEKAKLQQQIFTEINTVITTYSSSQGYDVVVDKNSLSAASGSPVFLYHSNKLIDITPEIITLINKSAPASTGAAPSGAAAPASPATHP